MTMEAECQEYHFKLTHYQQVHNMDEQAVQGQAQPAPQHAGTRRQATPRADIKALARRWMTFWQGGDLGRFDVLHTQDFVDRSAAGRPADRTGFRKGIEDLYAKFPDFVAVVEFIAVDEAMNLATIRWSARGGATSFSGIEIIRCQAGQVAERWGEWDASAA